MSQHRTDLKRRSAALSTNNRGFVAGSRFSQAREHLNDEDDEDVRLETYRLGLKVSAYKAIAEKSSRGLKNIEILEDSPNGYEICSKAPPERDRAIKYYSFQLRQYNVTRFPEEYGLIHYSLGKVFFKDRPENQVNYDARSKSIENALHHFRLSAETFDYDSFPNLFGVINIFIGQLFRERATLISSRSLLAKRGVNMNDCCQIAVAQLMEAQSSFLGSQLHDTEYVLANLETAWVYVLQITEAIHEEGRDGEEEELINLREQAVVALERAQSIAETLSTESRKPRGWNPSDQTSHPEHIRLLLQDQSIEYVGGMISYLYGRIYQDWSDSLEHQGEAFNYYCRCCKPNRLPMDREQWVDAHHRAAHIAIKFPHIIDPDFGRSQETDSDICFVSAVNHLTQALKSPSLMPHRRMDLLFHLAQAQIARLQMITDRVPEGKSLVKALAKSEGIQIMKAVEKALVLAMQGSTAANTQSTQDAFIYYFSCLKLSEFRMLQAAAEAGLSDDARQALLEDSISQLVNALLSRSIIDNLDLHYVATSQMSQMLTASKRDNSAAKWYSKTLLVLSAIGNRVQGAPIDLRQTIQGRFWEEAEKQHSNSVLASTRACTWMKQHLGPLMLTEAPVSGYAYWNMEMNLDPHEVPIEVEKEEVVLTYAQAKAGRAPPSAIRPHLSESESLSKHAQNLLRGQDIETAGNSYAQQMALESGVQHLQNNEPAVESPSAPHGEVPLWAMGHHPDFQNIDKMTKTNKDKIEATKVAEEEAKKKKSFFSFRSGNNGTANIDENGIDNGLSPYAGRRRHLVPNMYLMATKVHDIVQESAENAIFLMPNQGSNKVQFKVKDDDIGSWIKKVDERDKEMRPKTWLGSIASMFKKGNKETVALVSTKTASEMYNPDGENVPDVDLFATTQAYFMFNSISRLQRHQLVLRANNLRVARSERATTILNGLSTEMAGRFKKYLKNLETASKKTAMPPITLRELSQRSFADLQGVFQSHVAICRINTELELFLFKELVHADYFLPMTICSPALTRHVGHFDKTLLDANALVCNLDEKEILGMNENVKDGKLAAGSDPKDAFKANGKKKKKLEREAEKKMTGKKAKTPGEIKDEIERLDLLKYGLAQKLDGSQYRGGSKEMLAKNLGDNECMMLWHHPTNSKHKIHVVLVWREDSKGKRPRYDDGSDKYRARSKPGKPSKTKEVKRKGIVMEICKSEIDSFKLGTLVKNYLDALHSYPATTRTSFATKALKTLSGYLALSEVLLMVPTFIDTFVICCPPLLRVLPWHLILVEYPNDKVDTGDLTAAETVAKGRIIPGVPKFSMQANLLDPDKSHESKHPTVEEHLMERYLVRMGPTLPIYEMVETAAGKLSNDLGQHRLASVDGESRALKSSGLRNSEIEVNCVNSIFSGDKDDYKTMRYDMASPKQFTTSKYYHVSRADREKNKQRKEFKRAAREAAKKKKAAAKATKKGRKRGKYEVSSSSSDGSNDSGSSESDASSEDDEAVENRRWLGNARVIHVSANRVYMRGEQTPTAMEDIHSSVPKEKRQPPNNTKFAALALPQYYNSNGVASKDTRTQLNTADLMGQVYFQNCALLVMSRFGIADGAKAAGPGKTGPPPPVGQEQSPYCSIKVLDANVEFLEACHLSGATSVLYPVWGPFEQGGLSTLASLIFMIRFYSELPVHSRKRHSICHAVRAAQLWMRDQSADQIIAWLAKCPLPEAERLVMIKELEIYVKVSDPHSDVPIYDAINVDSNVDTVRSGSRKFFSHWLQWGPYIVSGQGGGVHPKELTEENEDHENDHLIYDETLNNISMEILLLKQEGRYDEAKELEARLSQLRIEAVKEKALAVKRLAVLAARAANDTFDALDKALLDQDDDELSIDEDDEDQLEKMKAREARKEEMRKIIGDDVDKESEFDLQRKAERKERRDAEKKSRSKVSFRKDVGPLTPGGGSEYLANLVEQSPHIAKLAQQETPISRFRGYIESLFPDEDEDYEYDSGGAPGSPKMKIKPKKFVPIPAGSAKMKALEKIESAKIAATQDDDDMYYAEGEEGLQAVTGPGQRQKKLRKEKTEAELEKEQRSLERQNERSFAMKGSSANLLDLLPRKKGAVEQVADCVVS